MVGQALRHYLNRLSVLISAINHIYGSKFKAKGPTYVLVCMISGNGFENAPIQCCMRCFYDVKIKAFRLKASSRVSREWSRYSRR